MLRPILFISSCVFFATTGCQPASKSSFGTVAPSRELLASVDLAARSKGRPISTADFLRAAGEPEHRVPRHALSAFFAKAAVPADAAAKAIHDIDVAYAQGVAARRHTQPEADQHETDFAIWLYRWHDPIALKTGGLLGARAGQASQYCVVVDDAVVGCGDIVRP